MGVNNGQTGHDQDALADARALKVIEESADTLGATIGGESTGIYSSISTRGFYRSHVIIGAGHRGMLCVNDAELERKVTVLRSLGRSSSQFIKSESIENRSNVKRGGILLACHHGLGPAQIEFMHDTLAIFANDIRKSIAS